MSNKNRISWELLRSLDTSTMSSSSTYYNLGTPLAFSSYKLKFVNASNVLVTISIDGTNDYDVLPATTAFVYDETQSQISTSSGLSVSKGTQFSCKSVTSGTGLVYLMSQYILTN